MDEIHYEIERKYLIRMPDRAWLEKEGLQVIATRVSTGEECSIVIEDGTGIMEAPAPKKEFTPKAWTPGEF